MSYMKNYGFNENQSSFPSQYETAGSMDINPSCPYTSSPGMVNQEIIYNNQVTGNIGYTINYNNQRTYNTLQEAYPYHGKKILEPLINK